MEEIVNKLPSLISYETFWIASWHYDNKRNKGAKSFLDRSLKENPNNYSSWILKSILDFVIDKNIKESFISISKAEKLATNSHEWCYNKLFLLFYSKEFPSAINLCSNLRKLVFEGEENIIKQVRDFNIKILRKDKSRAQLYFWIGYISLFKEKNYCNALEDFENYEKYMKIKASLLDNRVRAYIKYIKKEMKI